jgi:aminobenzoyl-glutamate utilization protein B
MVAAKVIATTGMDILTNPELAKEAKAFFLKATEGKPYQSPIPMEQKPPIAEERDQ